MDDEPPQGSVGRGEAGGAQAPAEPLPHPSSPRAVRGAIPQLLQLCLRIDRFSHYRKAGTSTVRL